LHLLVSSALSPSEVPKVRIHTAILHKAKKIFLIVLAKFRLSISETLAHVCALLDIILFVSLKLEQLSRYQRLKVKFLFVIVTKKCITHLSEHFTPNFACITIT
jgi:hypothetical protein